ncbi:hypothetical protein E1281_30570 [Actinomadura sp. KC345]|uniref:hypothetical protein n=1 Tax=Actinomadura sp. KC345 TaxID=2530371 RepID=UPI001048CEC7|nr:hypothetical protein [Actinomadura sp. KC345]TDC45367.1 hypothetical protein E1281_30570 [Actinomadura sp. KC345]
MIPRPALTPPSHPAQCPTRRTDSPPARSGSKTPHGPDTGRRLHGRTTPHGKAWHGFIDDELDRIVELGPQDTGILHRRLFVEALADATGAALETPAPLEASPSANERDYDAALAQIKDIIVPRSEDPSSSCAARAWRAS